MFACIVRVSIHHEGFISLVQLDCQGTGKRCCIEVYFLSQVPSSLLKNEIPNISN